MKKLRAKYWDHPENYEVTTQNENEIMQKMMQSPQKKNNSCAKYLDQAKIMESLHKIMILCRKWCNHCTKWKSRVQNMDHRQNYGVTAHNDDIMQKITTQNERVAHKILRLCAKLWSQSTKLWDHAENDAITTQNEKVMSKILSLCRK